MPSARLKNKKHVIPLTLLQFSDFGTHLLIEAEVNRVKNCYFVVDTGASSSVVDSNIKSLKIIKPDNDISSFALSEGSMETAFCIIKKFKAGDVVFKDYYMACMDLSALQKMYKKVSKDKVIGLVLVDNTKSQREIEERDIRNLTTFTNQAGLAIDNARLFEMEKNFVEELKRQVDIAKRELEQTQAQLIQSERLSALGEMAAVVAHEVRNPMASIRASAQRISKKIANEDPNKKYTRYIIEESDRLERVVKNILLFSGDSTPQSVDTDMNKLLEDVLYFLQPEIESSQVQLVKMFDESISMLKIDPALIRQVLLNVIQNGLHFMVNRERRDLKVATMQDGTNIIVEISDTGPGIPEENIRKIFDPFFTTKPSGTGLGLAISNRIIEAHKGRIEVQSVLNYGSTFKIILPLS